MEERLEIGYIVLDPDPDPEEYADTLTITGITKPTTEDNPDAADRQQDQP